MIERLIEGLTIIRTVSGNQEVGSHAYVVFVPDCNKADYDADQLELLEKELGWGWSDEMGWVFACIS
jgi:hypothetical protein